MIFFLKNIDQLTQPRANTAHQKQTIIISNTSLNRTLWSTFTTFLIKFSI